jgi:hypothetical protein
MNRREAMFSWLMALPMAMRRQVFGPMPVDRWMSEGHYGKRVFCNGVEITDRCVFFDDERGYAECYRHNTLGKPWFDGVDVAKEVIWGRIEVRR